MTADDIAKHFREWAILDAEHTRALRHRALLDLPLSAWTKEDRSDEHWVVPEELAKMQADADAVIEKLAGRMRAIEEAHAPADELAARLRAAEVVIEAARRNESVGNGGDVDAGFRAHTAWIEALAEYDRAGAGGKL